MRISLEHLREKETARCGPEECPDFNIISDVYVFEAPSRVLLIKRLMK